MILFRMTVPGKPIPQGRARTTRFGTYYPKTSKAHRLALAREFVGNHIREDEGPLSITVELAGARKNSDLDNHAKMILDALQDANVIASDDVRVVRELVVRTVDGEARTEVTIRRMEA
jgi:Holliday junction resolvase RusA-like endonuclease